MHPGIKGQVPGPSSHLSPVWRRPNLPSHNCDLASAASEGRGREFESRRVHHLGTWTRTSGWPASRYQIVRNPAILLSVAATPCAPKRSRRPVTTFWPLGEAGRPRSSTPPPAELAPPAGASCRLPSWHCLRGHPAACRAGTLAGASCPPAELAPSRGHPARLPSWHRLYGERR